MERFSFEESKGKIDVSIAAIASIAYDALMSCYGVVGTASKGFATDIADAFSGDSKRGVVVREIGGQIVIDLFVVVEYGTRIASVARSAMNVVKYNVEQALGLPVAEVNVHVQELRVSDHD
ncbi:MAG: Asp23/Gls24 family envelope stress response protein [Anaerolineae bacterium]|nr:Asp23/Gls24 family envelope stress response protein [Anaerolineae bacterium]